MKFENNELRIIKRILKNKFSSLESELIAFEKWSKTYKRKSLIWFDRNGDLPKTMYGYASKKAFEEYLDSEIQKKREIIDDKILELKPIILKLSKMPD